MKKYILSIDQGTTGTTSMLTCCESLEVIGKVNIEFEQIFPKPGWVEHNLNDIWHTVESSTLQVLHKHNISSSQISSIGITNQRETTCAYTKEGVPLANAIVWQDRRTSDYCEANKAEYEPLKSLTGLPLDPYFSATKMRWLLENNYAVEEASTNNNLHFSTIDSFLLFKMSGLKSFFTEPSNASRTLLMELSSCDWNDKLLKHFGLSKDQLPIIKDSFSDFGTTYGLSFLPDGIPITCILGDQQAALFGQAGSKQGDIKCTYGTGAFILLNTGSEIILNDDGLLTTVAYKYNGKAFYALEGSSYIAGAAVQWLRDNLSLLDSSSMVEHLANSVQNLELEMEHLIFMPFFTGIGTPYWNSEAKGAILGLTRDTMPKHLARACLDGMALSINDSIQAIIKHSPTKISELRVDGGASQNDTLMQIQANFSQFKIVRPKVVETTAYGVALGALIGLGKLNISDIERLWKEDKDFMPLKNSYVTKKQQQWNHYIQRLFC